MGRVADAAQGSCDALLAGLDPEQREVALAVRGPVCVLAGAGTGKTRSITHRIAYAVGSGTVNAAHVLALTFTVRAAGELRGRLRQLGADGSGAGRVRASTFHAAALRQLNYFWPRIIGGRPPQLIDSKLSLVREAAKLAHVRLEAAPENPRTPGSAAGTGVLGPGLADAAAEIEWAKATQVRPDSYADAAARAGRSPAAGAEQMASVFAGYERLRRERHLIDFESVLELTAAILLEHREAADQVREAFRHFVVDEYQDVNPLQKLLLDAWLGDRDDLCVVGDPQQVIYSFTGATPAYLTGFTAEFPGATVVRLVRDYRSTPQVVAVANQLARAAGGPRGAGSPPVSGGPGRFGGTGSPPVSGGPGRFEGTGSPPVSGAPGRFGGTGRPSKLGGVQGGRPPRAIQPELPPGPAPPALVAQRPPGPEPVLTEYSDDADEAAGLAARARALLAVGVPAREIALLVRINAETERFEQALAAAGVPYVVRGAERFYERPVVRQVLVLLRGAARGEAGDRTGTGDRTGAGDGTGPGGRDALPASVRHVLTGVGFNPDAAVPPAGGAAARERWESLAAIAQLADDMHAARPDAGLADFSAELTLRAELGHAPAVEGVTLASMHAAKGLEWDAVLLPGLVEGLMPIVHARTAAAVEEERRLLYVAVTRARQHLYLSWSPSRVPGGRNRGPARQRSRFLDDVPIRRRVHG